jgi:hypothetical protein
MSYRRWVRAAASLLLLGCTHSDAFVVPPIATLGPYGTGPDVQLTFNPDQNYWPTWTQDGRGVLYAFVDGESATPPNHRCLGLLPAAGGSRLWQLCDNRAVRNDSLSSYVGYALDSAGRLLLAEATAPANAFADLPRVTLWLADTSTPYVRTRLLSLPQTVSGFTLTWLSEIRWTGVNTFIALGQQFGAAPHCNMCDCNPCPRDSIFGDGGMVVTGTIVGGVATLQAVAGTDSATSYSLAENGGSIVYTRHHDLRLFKVPIGGGTPVPTPIQRTVADTAALMAGELVGVSCKGSTCVVASDDIDLTDAYSSPFCIGNICQGYGGFHAPLGNSQMQLLSVSLTSGATQVLQAGALSSMIFASPQISPTTGDLLLQRGGMWGHLQTFATAGRGNGELHVLKGVVP